MQLKYTLAPESGPHACIFNLFNPIYVPELSDIFFNRRYSQLTAGVTYLRETRNKRLLCQIQPLQWNIMWEKMRLIPP